MIVLVDYCGCLRIDGGSGLQAWEVKKSIKINS